ncbi:MAG: molybdopterin molybdotransferase MoeA [Methanobacteriaceae archaeon]|jgi:molybdopterin molybdotransferase|nr:MAG: molybdopterin molybdenumtransferase MoeA [Methanobacterium sp. BRmetb2]MCC7557403.1 molybdopterin molybdotransferase MoeA [Methanobacteriaceae archaeon]
MFLSELIPIKKALYLINKYSMSFKTEIISLEDANSRVLAVDVKSIHNSPPFDKSAMDGYAIKAENTFGYSETNPADFVVIDQIGAGEKSSMEINHREAVKIATGAPIPEGADAVVMEEYTNFFDNKLEVAATLTPGENVSVKGEDIKQGEIVLKRGRILRPQDLGIIASAGYAKIEVYKKPVITVITTGNELVKPKNSLEGAQIINSNHYTLKALVESALATPKMVHCGDDLELMSNHLENAVNKSDAVITTGGTAISKGDVVVDAVAALGDVIVHGVAVRPGKPFGYGIIHEKPVFMLSGYPVAAIVQYDIFVRNFLLKMQNISREPQRIKKVAAKKIPSTLGRTDFIRAKTDNNKVYPIMTKGSGVIRSMVDSNSYIYIKENVEGIPEGEECEVLLYDSFKV